MNDNYENLMNEGIYCSQGLQDVLKEAQRLLNAGFLDSADRLLQKGIDSMDPSKPIDTDEEYGIACSKAAEIKWNDISKGETSYCTACAAQRGEDLCTKCQKAIDEAEAERAESQPWNDDLNPQ